MTLVEMMVASLLGIFLLYAVYQTFELSERTSRNAMTIADMQISGLYAIFLMEREIGNAGNGILPAARALARCQDAPLIGAPFLSLRPLPVVIKNGKNDTSSDEIFVYYGTSPLHAAPLAIKEAALSTASLTVQTPLGFSKENAFIIAPPAGNCYAYNTPKTDPVFVDPVIGTTHFSLDPFPHFDTFYEDIREGGLLIDLGVPVRHYFYVQNDTLTMQEWRLEGHQWKLKRTDPLVANVIRFWAQYGIDTTKDNNIDQWVPATGRWSADSLQAAPLDQIQQIKALRIAFVLRSEEPDKELKNDYTASVFQDCPVHTTCSGGKTVHIAHDVTKPYGWRYRTYETTIPIRNAIWNFKHE